MTRSLPPLHYRNRGSYYDRIVPAADLPTLPPPPYHDAFPVKLTDGDWAWLPFLALPPDFTTAIAYLCITENSFALEDRLSTAMAELVRPLGAEIVVGMPTLGMVLAASVGKKLGHDFYVPLSYSRKFWFEDELSIPVNSITTPVQPKTVYIDPRLIERLEGKRVLLVEDVISTGGTVAAELALMKKIGAHVVGVVTAIRETRVWIDKLAAIDPAYPALVTSPICCPLFRRSGAGWVPDWTTMPATITATTSTTTST
jgi:adenine/guanine phosphoribosyltransferase-like PRPP-binding protein